MYTNLPEVFKAICSLFQFQALRAMVQANPQILQVFFIKCFLVLVVSLINLITYVNIDYFLTFFSAAAYASGTRKAKSTPNAPYPGASG